MVKWLLSGSEGEKKVFDLLKIQVRVVLLTFHCLARVCSNACPSYWSDLWYVPPTASTGLPHFMFAHQED